MEIKNQKYEGILPVEKNDDNKYEIEFRDVSFHYPNSSEMVLSHVNIKLQVGQKMAVVGKNGAGKTTFIKLLCRLYEPSEGEILLNGNIKEYDYSEYMRSFIEMHKILGVDFESFNPTAYGFWLKYFTAYTNSVVRRIDECVLHN